MFALGADPERLRWGTETARAARRDAGLDPDAIGFGAYVNLVCHPDVEVARRLVSGGLSTFARFAVMHGSVSGPVSDAQREVLERLHGAYDMKSHTRVGAPQAELLTPEFIDRYAIVGPPETCLHRLRELEALGLERLTLIGPTSGADREAARRAEQLLTQELLPVFGG
jgi:5,10-methylenetetrahydromethanopterin reductase